MFRFAATPLVAVAFSVSALAFGCNSGETKSPSVGLTEPVNPPKFPDQGRHASRTETNTLYNMYVTEGIRSVCAGPSPYFHFDASSTTIADPTLQTLAGCMKDGPLKGRSIRLIGRTDPRGTEEYNEKLGAERAKSVKTYLVKAGVEDARIEVMSLGKQDASPTPSDWPSDRRVQIELKD